MKVPRMGDQPTYSVCITLPQRPLEGGEKNLSAMYVGLAYIPSNHQVAQWRSYPEHLALPSKLRLTNRGREWSEFKLIPYLFVLISSRFIRRVHDRNTHVQ